VSDKIQMEAGIQPLDHLMINEEIRNNDLVSISKEGLTHKQVSKGRKGRKITKKIQLKILRAWNLLKDQDLYLDDLFNYQGK
jgi:N-formylglutamate amidohydrolase